VHTFVSALHVSIPLVFMAPETSSLKPKWISGCLFSLPLQNPMCVLYLLLEATHHARSRCLETLAISRPDGHLAVFTMINNSSFFYLSWVPSEIWSLLTTNSLFALSIEHHGSNNSPESPRAAFSTRLPGSFTRDYVPFMPLVHHVVEALSESRAGDRCLARASRHGWTGFI
jgi:hypothetical protein